MTTKYSASLHDQHQLGYISDYNWYNRNWASYWFCRELAVNELRNKLDSIYYTTNPTVLRLIGENMRGRTHTEQVGMLKFANIMFPEHFTFADDVGIYIESENIAEGIFKYPMPETLSVAYFFIKYLTIQMQDRVDIDRLCKTFIKRKHQCFQHIPDQQLGTAFFVWSYIHYKQEMLNFRDILSHGNGPGTAMRALADEDEDRIGEPTEACKLYSFLLDEWFSQYQTEITKKLDEHCRGYSRVYYMPLLLQDLYKRAYDGDGYFDGRTYGDDEW